jgi:hypothetical protein
VAAAIDLPSKIRDRSRRPLKPMVQVSRYAAENHLPRRFIPHFSIINNLFQ